MFTEHDRPDPLYAHLRNFFQERTGMELTAMEILEEIYSFPGLNLGETPEETSHILISTLRSLHMDGHIGAYASVNEDGKQNRIIYVGIRGNDGSGP